MERINFIVNNFGKEGCDLQTLTIEAELYVKGLVNDPNLSPKELKEKRMALAFQIERVREILDLSVEEVK